MGESCRLQLILHWHVYESFSLGPTKFHASLLIHVVQAELLLLRIPSRYSRRGCDILPCHFDVELHALVSLSKNSRSVQPNSKLSWSYMSSKPNYCCYAYPHVIQGDVMRFFYVIFAVEWHALVLRSKFLRDSDSGEPLKNAIIRTIVPLGKMLWDAEPDELSEIIVEVTALWWIAWNPMQMSCCLENDYLA